MNDLRIDSIASQVSATLPKHADTPAKIKDAAQQFEALLISQVLRSASENGGWLGSGGDSASSCAGGFAQQQLAASMAKSGGFGLASLIAQGLERGR